MRIYSPLLKKLAGATSESSLEPITPSDNVQDARLDRDRIIEGDRSYLHSIFSRAGAVQSNQSAEVNKLFSSTKNAETSSPLLKLAQRDSFFSVLYNRGNLLKIASPVHFEITFGAFCDELDKIEEAYNSK